MEMSISLDDLSSNEAADFLEEHVEEMKSVSPPESKHALDLEGLRRADFRFWVVRMNSQLVGCAALKDLGEGRSELKSMRVAENCRGKGIASRLLAFLIVEARGSGFRELSLETGAMPFFEPARQLYRKTGFQECGPFAEYVDDPNSVFMTLIL